MGPYFLRCGWGDESTEAGDIHAALHADGAAARAALAEKDPASALLALLQADAGRSLWSREGQQPRLVAVGACRAVPMASAFSVRPARLPQLLQGGRNGESLHL